jgi:hypothetical protein
VQAVKPIVQTAFDSERVDNPLAPIRAARAQWAVTSYQNPRQPTREQRSRRPSQMAATPRQTIRPCEETNTRPMCRRDDLIQIGLRGTIGDDNAFCYQLSPEDSDVSYVTSPWQ